MKQKRNKCPEKGKCKLVSRFNYHNEGWICSGVVKNPHVSFDVIKLCLKNSVGHKNKDGEIREFWFSPEEALDITSLLNEAVRSWLWEFKPFVKFYQKGLKGMKKKKLDK